MPPRWGIPHRGYPPITFSRQAGLPLLPPARTCGVPLPGSCGPRLSFRRRPLSANARSRCTGRTRSRSRRVCSEWIPRPIFFRLVRFLRRVPRASPRGVGCVGVGPRRRTPRHRRPYCLYRQRLRASRQPGRLTLRSPWLRPSVPAWRSSRCPGTYPRATTSFEVVRARTKRKKRKKALTPRTTSPPTFPPSLPLPSWPCRRSVASAAPGLSPRSPCAARRGSRSAFGSFPRMPP